MSVCRSCSLRGPFARVPWSACHAATQAIFCNHGGGRLMTARRRIPDAALEDRKRSSARRASRFHMLTVAANRLERERADETLIENLRKAAAGPAYGGRTFEVDEK